MTAFINGLTHVIVGNSAATTVQFIVPDYFQNLSSGYITYYLQDANGAVYSTGLGTNFQVTPIVNASKVTADFSITVPSDIPTNIVGTDYQVRFTLSLPDEGNLDFEIFDTLKILPSAQVEMGAEDVVELFGSIATLKLILEDQADNQPVCELFLQNNVLTNENTVGPIPLADGYEYSVDVPVNTTVTMPSLNPYNVIWHYDVGGKSFVQSSSLFVVTPAMMQAMKDVLLIVNKARRHMGFQDIFSEHEVLSYLRNGADLFNGYFHPTNFTMTNATGSVRYFWIQCSAINALRSQYLMEGEAAFNFSGQAVSLDIDRSQYYESLASTLESALQEPLRQLKTNLSKRGLTAGDGNVNPLALSRNAIGTIGISLSQVTNIRTTGFANWMIGPRGGI